MFITSACVWEYPLVSSAVVATAGDYRKTYNINICYGDLDPACTKRSFGGAGCRNHSARVYSTTPIIHYPNTLFLMPLSFTPGTVNNYWQILARISIRLIWTASSNERGHVHFADHGEQANPRFVSLESSA